MAGWTRHNRPVVGGAVDNYQHCSFMSFFLSKVAITGTLPSVQFTASSYSSSHDFGCYGFVFGFYCYTPSLSQLCLTVLTLGWILFGWRHVCMSTWIGDSLKGSWVGVSLAACPARGQSAGFSSPGGKGIMQWQAHRGCHSWFHLGFSPSRHSGSGAN